MPRALRKKIAKVTQRTLEKRLPKGILKFPYVLKDPKAVDFAEVTRVRRQFGVSDLFRVHGVSFKAGQKTFVVIGPGGVGKSTFLRQAIANHNVRPIDDSHIILGRNAKSRGFKVIETGWYDARAHIAKVSKKMRSAVGYVSPYKKKGLTEKAFKRRQKLGGALLYASEAVGRVTYRAKSRKPFKPSAFNLTDLIWIQSPRERIVPRQISEREISKTTDAAIINAVKGAGVRISRIDSTHPNLLKELERLVFS